MSESENTPVTVTIQLDRSREARTLQANEIIHQPALRELAKHISGVGPIRWTFFDLGSHEASPYLFS